MILGTFSSQIKWCILKLISATLSVLFWLNFLNSWGLTNICRIYINIFHALTAKSCNKYWVHVFLLTGTGGRLGVVGLGEVHRCDRLWEWRKVSAFFVIKPLFYFVVNILNPCSFAKERKRKGMDLCWREGGEGLGGVEEEETIIKIILWKIYLQ